MRKKDGYKIQEKILNILVYNKLNGQRKIVQVKGGSDYRLTTITQPLENRRY